MKLAAVNHIAIICSDYARSKAFYIDVLGLTLEQEVYRAARDSWKCDLAVNGEYQIELFSFPEPPPRPNAPEAAGLRHLAFTVDDLDACIAELESKGVPVEPVREDETRGHKRFTFIKDPDGLPLEFCER